MAADSLKPGGYAYRFREVARIVGLPEVTVARVVRLWLAILKDDIWQGLRPRIPGLGLFTLKTIKARVYVDRFGTGETKTSKAKRVVQFRPTEQFGEQYPKEEQHDA